MRVPNAMDGVPHVTQPPVEPGGTFIYEFTPKDAGTFWFHPHVRSSEQVERGLYGVLIVEDAAPPPYARDVVWVLDDWLLDATRQIFAAVQHAPRPRCTTGAGATSSPSTAARTRALDARGGERIRLRLLNASNGRIYAPDFGGLDAKIIAVDGLYLARADPARAASSSRPATGSTWTSRFPPAPASRSLAVIDRFYPQRPNHLADDRRRRRRPRPTAGVPVAGARARARVVGGRSTSR